VESFNAGVSATFNATQETAERGCIPRTNTFNRNEALNEALTLHFMKAGSAENGIDEK